MIDKFNIENLSKEFWDPRFFLRDLPLQLFGNYTTDNKRPCITSNNTEAPILAFELVTIDVVGAITVFTDIVDALLEEYKYCEWNGRRVTRAAWTITVL